MSRLRAAFLLFARPGALNLWCNSYNMSPQQVE
jgi:hypothetical protein